MRIPVGSKVEVRLVNQEKLKGKIGAVSDDGIVVKYTKAGQPEERRIAFTEMMSVKRVSTAKKVLLYTAIVFGVLMVIGIIGMYTVGYQS